MSICSSSLACSRILMVAAIVFAIQIADSAPGVCQHPELAESISQTGQVWPLRFQAFANHDKYLITESKQGIIVWDVETGRQLMNVETFTTSCQLSPDGILMLYASRGSKSGTLCLHEVGSAEPRLRIDLPEGCDAGSLRFSQGGRFVLARDSAKSLLHVWNSRTGVRLLSPKIPFYDDLRVVQRHAQFKGQPREKVPEGDVGVQQLQLALQTAEDNTFCIGATG